MRRKTIGFDRDIDIRWMDAVAERAAGGHTADELRAFVWRMLEGQVVGHTPHSGRGKTATVLMHIWGTVPPELEPLRTRALMVIASGSPSDRLAAHWSMAMTTYPFFADVVAATGRLLALQRRASLAQVTRRIAENWGDRSTMTRAARRVIRSIVRWGLLRDTQAGGVYERVPELIRPRGLPAEVLIEALLTRSDSRELPLASISTHPALFPFELKASSGELRLAPGLVVHRSGLDSDVVAHAARERRRT